MQFIPLMKKDQHLLVDFFCNIINLFTVTFDHLLNKGINSLKKK